MRKFEFDDPFDNSQYDSTYNIIKKNISYIESEIKKLQSVKRKHKKDLQKYCPHKNKVYKMGKLKPMVYMAYQSPSYDDYVKPKVYCQDCGKILN